MAERQLEETQVNLLLVAIGLTPQVYETFAIVVFVPALVQAPFAFADAALAEEVLATSEVATRAAVITSIEIFLDLVFTVPPLMLR